MIAFEVIFPLTFQKNHIQDLFYSYFSLCKPNFEFDLFAVEIDMDVLDKIALVK